MRVVLFLNVKLMVNVRTAACVIVLLNDYWLLIVRAPLS